MTCQLCGGVRVGTVSRAGLCWVLGRLSSGGRRSGSWDGRRVKSESWWRLRVERMPIGRCVLYPCRVSSHGFGGWLVLGRTGVTFGQHIQRTSVILNFPLSSPYCKTHPHLNIQHTTNFAPSPQNDGSNGSPPRRTPPTPVSTDNINSGNGALNRTPKNYVLPGLYLPFHAQ